MNVMDFFKTTPPAAASTPTAQGGSANNNPADLTKNLGSTTPATNADGTPIKSITPPNPLDIYSKMYDDANATSEIVAPTFKLDSKVLGEVSKSMDFTKGIDPTLMENALKGDAKSLLQVMQSVGQNTYSASLEHLTTLTDKHLTNRSAFEQSQINKGVRDQLTSSELSSAPNYSHPVVKAELNRVASMFAKSNPDATPQEIAKAAQRHLSDLHAALNPAKTPEQKASDAGEMDWSKYLS